MKDFDYKEALRPGARVFTNYGYKVFNLTHMPKAANGFKLVGTIDSGGGIGWWGEDGKSAVNGYLKVSAPVSKLFINLYRHEVTKETEVRCFRNESYALAEVDPPRGLGWKLVSRAVEIEIEEGKGLD